MWLALKTTAGACHNKEGNTVLELYLNQPNKIEIRVSEPLPITGPNEVKIKLLYGGICGSDLRVYQGKLAHAAYPLRPGHELLGHVIEAGVQSQYRVGTRVASNRTRIAVNANYA
jgi:L-iditol 2-dehydrogenase